jgi:hypothetical protein
VSNTYFNEGSVVSLPFGIPVPGNSKASFQTWLLHGYSSTALHCTRTELIMIPDSQGFGCPFGMALVFVTWASILPFQNIGTAAALKKRQRNFVRQQP